MRDYSEYQLLIDEIAEVDCDAAAYLLHVAPLETRRLMRKKYKVWIPKAAFNPSGELSMCFVWKATPQGQQYWNSLDDSAF